MIHKVNRPAFLSLVTQPKQSENDPGGSQGSGNFYEGQGKPNQTPKSGPEKSSENTIEPGSEPLLAVVVSVEQLGMTEVVKDFLEQRKNEAPASPGLSVRYTLDSQPAKGLLLNKKAE